MNIYIALTDQRWFQNLRYSKPDEANFWVPGKTISLPRLQDKIPDRSVLLHFVPISHVISNHCHKTYKKIHGNCVFCCISPMFSSDISILVFALMVFLTLCNFCHRKASRVQVLSFDKTLTGVGGQTISILLQYRQLVTIK